MIRSIILLALLPLAVSSCTSAQKLKESKSCNVWREVPVFGADAVTVAEGRGSKKGKCRLFGFLWCESISSEFRPDEKAITLDRGGLQGPVTVAHLHAGVMTYEKSPGAKTTPITIDPTQGQLESKVTVAGFDATRVVHFNPQCTTEDIAVGAAIVLAQ